MLRSTVLLAALCASIPTFAQTPPGDLALTDICPSCGALNSPLAVRHAGDGSGRLFIGEQNGSVRVFQGGTYLATPFLTFIGTSNVPPGGFTSGGERGLLGIAFHPNFATNRFFFVNYTDGQGDTVVARYQTQAANPNAIDTSTRTVIIRVDQDFANHNGGNILFGPDGFLYIGMGDGGSGNDPCNRAQSLTPADLVPNESTTSCPVDTPFTASGGNADSRALLGKMLRLNVDATTPASLPNELCADNGDGSANYAIPTSNPFAGAAGVSGACDEVLDYGLRNPWRFSFDRVTGDLFIGDVGQNAVEEVSFRAAGPVTGAINFGWDCREGLGMPGGVCRPGDVLTPPILSYPQSGIGQSITGGYRYRGAIPGLVGIYMFADYVSRRIWFVTETSPGVWGPQPTGSNHWALAASNVLTFGESQDGALYVGAANGRVYRFTSATELTDLIMANGFE